MEISRPSAGNASSASPLMDTCSRRMPGKSARCRHRSLMAYCTPSSMSDCTQSVARSSTAKSSASSRFSCCSSCAGSHSARKPRWPRFTPSTGVRQRSSRPAVCRSVPSPPSTTASSGGGSAPGAKAWVPGRGGSPSGVITCTPWAEKRATSLSASGSASGLMRLKLISARRSGMGIVLPSIFAGLIIRPSGTICKRRGGNGGCRRWEAGRMRGAMAAETKKTRSRG